MDPGPENRSRAYRYGWQDGRYGGPERFTESRRPAELNVPSKRLDNYRRHRAGHESRRSGYLLEAS